MGEKNSGAARATTKTRTAEKNGRPVRVFGYARVSSRDQNLARQVDALTAFGIDERSLFCDKASGKDFLRPSYQKLVRRMRPGDVLVVKSIDRLGRSYEDIIEEWRRLTKERGVSIVVLDMPLLDTARAAATSPASSSRTSCCSCSRTWRRSSARTSTSARPRASPRRASGACGLGGRASRGRPCTRGCERALRPASSRPTTRRGHAASPARRLPAGSRPTARRSAPVQRAERNLTKT